MIPSFSRASVEPSRLKSEPHNWPTLPCASGHSFAALKPLLGAFELRFSEELQTASTTIVDPPNRHPRQDDCGNLTPQVLGFELGLTICCSKELKYGDIGSAASLHNVAAWPHCRSTEEPPASGLDFIGRGAKIFGGFKDSVAYKKPAPRIVRRRSPSAGSTTPLPVDIKPWYYDELEQALSAAASSAKTLDRESFRGRSKEPRECLPTTESESSPPVQS